MGCQHGRGAGGGDKGAGAWAMVMAHRDGTGVCLLAENEHCVNKRKGNGCWAEKNHSWLLQGEGSLEKLEAVVFYRVYEKMDCDIFGFHSDQEKGRVSWKLVMESEIINVL